MVAGDPHNHVPADTSCIIPTMIDLNCPRCEASLQIDDGVRGGVCRCYSCGTLLTVPSDPSSERAESLRRPERPDEPGSAEPSGGDGDEPTVYETNSGRTVQLSEKDLSGVPVAGRRRMAIRVGTMAAVCAVLLLLVGAVAWGAWAVFANQGPEDPEHIHQDVFGIIDNPFLKTEPNFLGLPVSGRTALVVDGSGAMQDYFGQLKRAVLHSLRTLEPGQQVQVILGHESEPLTFPENPQPAKAVSASTLEERLEPIYASGGSALAAAIERAVQGEPYQVMLVARQLPGPRDMETVREHIRASGAVLVAVLIDRESPELTEIAENSGGSVIAVAGGRLQRWYREYLRQQRQKEQSGGESGDEQASSDS